MATKMRQRSGRKICENIWVLMRRAGMSQRDVAEAVGMNRETFHRRMRHNGGWLFEEVEAIAEALDVTIEEIRNDLPDEDEWESRRVVRHVGLEPTTR